ncbi:MAG: hypothetical protein ACYCSF_13380 [Acidimicrobiales bacterium]
MTMVVRYERDFELNDLEQRAQFALAEFGEPARNRTADVELGNGWRPLDRDSKKTTQAT